MNWENAIADSWLTKKEAKNMKSWLAAIDEFFLVKNAVVCSGISNQEDTFGL